MFSAIKSYGGSLDFLRKHDLLWFLWFPLIITALVLIGGFQLTSMLTDEVTTAMRIWLNELAWLPEWAGFLQDVFYWILWILFRILLYFALAFIGGSVILLLMAPILTWLSERIAVVMGKHPVDFNLKQFTKDLMRAVVLALKNGLLQIALTLACFLIGLIPLIGAAAPFLLFGLNAFFYGYNFMDYTLERHQLSVNESNRLVWKKKGTTLALGTPFALWMLIPFIGPMTGGFMAIFATVAATTTLEKEEHLTPR